MEIDTPARMIIYRALVRAANCAAPCPSGDELAMICGLDPTTTVYHLRQLERRGMIQVQRYQRSRIVTITATGNRTRHSASTTPHWRDRIALEQAA